MTVEQAFKELIERGFDIKKIDEEQFLVTDNGKFGFLEEEEPFVVDGEDILEIHEDYVK
jgi:hypothetical protein